MRPLSSGISDIDDVLSGLLAGDNVVWVGEGDVHDAIEGAFLAEGGRIDAPCVYATTTDTPRAVAARVGGHVDVLDARPGRRYADPLLLEQTLLERGRAPGARIVIDGLDSFVRRWRSARALAMFGRVCPQMFDLGDDRLLAGQPRRLSCDSRWRSPGNPMLHRRVRRAPAGGQGRGPHRCPGPHLQAPARPRDAVHLDHERALGRLAEGLRVLRAQRNLTQSDLARLVGVSPSAISQAEAGRRGLGLDTLLTLTEALGMGLDELLSSAPDSAYVLDPARPDRAPPGHHAASRRPPSGASGLPRPSRAGESGASHQRPTRGSSSSSSPPAWSRSISVRGARVRAGDAVLATRVPIRGWRNLVAQPARLFWVLRDERIERPDG